MTSEIILTFDFLDESLVDSRVRTSQLPLIQIHRGHTSTRAPFITLAVFSGNRGRNPSFRLLLAIAGGHESGYNAQFKFKRKFVYFQSLRFFNTEDGKWKQSRRERLVAKKKLCQQKNI